MKEQKILIVEDEKELAKILGDYLKLEGFAVEISYDGEDGIRQFQEKGPALMILDIMLPKKDGVEVLKEVRAVSDIPVIMLSAKAGEMDKVISLGAGADDYVTKPFSPIELVARVKAQMRRYGAFGRAKEEGQKMEVGALTFFPASYEVYIGKEQLPFTTKEFEMLSFFATHLNQVFSKEQIYENVWGTNEYGDISSVAVYIRRLRMKLEEYHLDYIKTIWGVGYKMTVESTAQTDREQEN
ncbi:MAG: response regulator transcription factor [Lachnospiraceae bacterium]